MKKKVLDERILCKQSEAGGDFRNKKYKEDK